MRRRNAKDKVNGDGAVAVVILLFSSGAGHVCRGAAEIFSRQIRDNVGDWRETKGARTRICEEFLEYWRVDESWHLDRWGIDLECENANL